MAPCGANGRPHRTHRRAGIFHHVTARAGDAELGDDAKRHVLGSHMRPEPAVEAYQHALRTPQRHHLRRQDVRELGRAAAEGERSEAADGAGMAVGNGVGCARQHHAKLRRNDMGDALLRVIDVEKPDGVTVAALAHRLEKRRARWVGAVVAARLGGDGVILHREGEVGSAHGPLLLLQLLEGVGGVQLVQHVPVDVDQIAAVGAAGHQMRVPDLVEQGGGHGGDTSGSACGTEEARGHSCGRP
jgi:hypothetical protein